MTPPGDETPEPAGGAESAATMGPARKGRRVALVLGATTVTSLALALGGAVSAFSASSDEPLDPAAEALSDLPTVTDFSIRAEEGCVFDPTRGGLVSQGLRVESESSGVLGLSFYVQRNSLDDVLPGYVSTVLTFDDDSRSHTFDVVVPVTHDEYQAGYDECQFSTTGEE
jgi:hypothetical protein